MFNEFLFMFDMFLFVVFVELDEFLLTILGYLKGLRVSILIFY